jgi:E3 ubiquitin-protein ligase RNF31
VQRIARRLLAEGRAANYDEAEVAASLLALKFGDTEALQAAKECSSVESALAFLQQECELCTGRFAMSQVSVIKAEKLKNVRKVHGFTLNLERKNAAFDICLASSILSLAIVKRLLMGQTSNPNRIRIR